MIEPSPEPAPEPQTAPYLRHPDWDRAVLEASAPEWAPSGSTTALFHREGADDLNTWLKSKRRGFCDRCWAPLEWTGKPKITCSSKCKMRRSRLTHDQWWTDNLYLLLLDRMDKIPYDDWERRGRHDKLQAIKENSYKPPPRKGHARPRRKPTDTGLLKDSYSTLSSVDSLRHHEWKAITRGSTKDQAADKLADKWFRDHEKDT